MADIQLYRAPSFRLILATDQRESCESLNAVYVLAFKVFSFRKLLKISFVTSSDKLLQHNWSTSLVSGAFTDAHSCPHKTIIRM
jgi:hypothetical protein